MSRPVYRRVQLLRAQFPASLGFASLQTCIEAATVAPLALDDTEYPSAQFGAVRLNEDVVASANGGVRLKIVGHAFGEGATTVPLKVAGAANTEFSLPAPPDESFKNGDFFMIVRDDNIIGLGDHMRTETAVKYLRELLAKRLLNPAYATLSTTNVFKYDAAQQLKDEGLDSIKFDATMAAAGLDKVEDDKKKNAVHAFIDGLLEHTKAVAGIDPDPKALAGVRVNISVSVVGGVKGAEMSKELLASAAKSLLSEDAENEPEVSARIVTKQGNSIALGEATVGNTYKIHRRSNESSLQDSEVWAALEDFDKKVQELGDLKT